MKYIMFLFIATISPACLGQLYLVVADDSEVAILYKNQKFCSETPDNNEPAYYLYAVNKQHEKGKVSKFHIRKISVKEECNTVLVWSTFPSEPVSLKISLFDDVNNLETYKELVTDHFQFKPRPLHKRLSSLEEVADGFSSF